MLLARVTVGWLCAAIVIGWCCAPASAAAADGDIFVPDIDAGQVKEVDPTTGAATTVATGLTFPYDVAMLPDGDLAALGLFGTVTRIDPDDGTKTPIASGDHLLETQDLTVATDGMIYVVNTNSAPHEVVRVDPVTGTQSVVASGNLLTVPTGIDAVPDGTLVVANPGNPGTVVRVNPATGAQTLVAQGDGTTAELRYANELVVECEGDILAVQQEAILRIDPATGDQTVVKSGTPLNNPAYGIGLAGDGDVLVSLDRPAEGYPATGVYRLEGDSLTLFSSGFQTPGGISVAPDDPSCNDDSAAPTANAAPTPAPNAAGWNREDVTVNLTASDEAGGSGVKEIHYSLSGAQAGSEVAPGAAASVPVTTEGTTTITYFARDNAGNSGSPQQLVIRLDKTAPAITIDRPEQGARYPVGIDVAADYACSDTNSTIASPGGCTGPVPDDSRLDTSSAGEKTFRVDAVDRAGNTASRSHTYAVVDDGDVGALIVQQGGRLHLKGTGVRNVISISEERTAHILEEGKTADGRPLRILVEEGLRDRCSGSGTSKVTCPRPHVVDLGGGNDWIEWAPYVEESDAYGGEGHDVIRFIGGARGNVVIGNAFGGPGDDSIDSGLIGTLRGEEGDDRITGAVSYGGFGMGWTEYEDQLLYAYGGPGADQIDSLGFLYGDDGDDSLGAHPEHEYAAWSVDGGAGDDRITAWPTEINGGTGRDTYDGSRQPELQVSLDGQANDGWGGGYTRRPDRKPGNFGTDIEVLVGGDRQDKLTGRKSQPTEIRGGRDADQLSGGAAADEIDGGEGIDAIDGGAGNDRLTSEDRPKSADTVTCGDGTDSVTADSRDVLGSSCERGLLQNAFLQASLRSAWISLSNPAAEIHCLPLVAARGTCNGTFELYPSKPPLAGAAKKKPRPLARVKFKLKSGRTGKVRLKLSPRARQTLRRRGKVSQLVTFQKGRERFRTVRDAKVR